MKKMINTGISWDTSNGNTLPDQLIIPLHRPLFNECLKVELWFNGRKIMQYYRETLT